MGGTPGGGGCPDGPLVGAQPRSERGRREEPNPAPSAAIRPRPTAIPPGEALGPGPGPPRTRPGSGTFWGRCL